MATTLSRPTATTTRREWSPTTEARVQGACAALLAVCVALGVLAFLMCARVVPAAPWSPIGQEQQQPRQTQQGDPSDPFGDLRDYMRRHHLRPVTPAPRDTAPESPTII